MTTRVAIVTGSNQGIGFWTVKGLCDRFGGDVFLTSRDSAKGLAAVEKLSKFGLQPKFHQLDVTNTESIEVLARFLKEHYGGVDLIINNASMFFLDSPVPNYEQARAVVDINYYSLKRIASKLYPLLRQNGRVVNVSSTNGHLSAIPDEEMRKQISDRNITEHQLDQIVKNFLDDVNNNTLNKAARSCRNYDSRFSKNAAYVLSVLHSKQLFSRNISVNAVHPGFCRTEASHYNGTMTAEEGASSTLYAALEAPQELSGKYIWCNSEVVDWYDASIPCADMLYCTKDDPSPYPQQEVPISKNTDTLLEKAI